MWVGDIFVIKRKYKPLAPLITGSIAHMANVRRYFGGFRPAGATVYSDQGGIWCERACHRFAVDDGMPDFTPIGEGKYGYPSGLQRLGDAYDFYLVFTARRHASALYAVVVSVCHKSVFY